MQDSFDKLIHEIYERLMASASNPASVRDTAQTLLTRGEALLAQQVLAKAVEPVSTKK